MTAFEDHFSKQARQYAHYRPHYSSELFVYLASVSPGRQLAWDCGTGNAQAARELVKYFDYVVATDASSDQIAQAVAQDRIMFRVERAEEVRLVETIWRANIYHWLMPAGIHFH